MKKGDLVRHKATGEIGIVLAPAVIPNPNNRMFFFMGDGLVMVERSDCWEVVAFSPVASIPANFSELVEAYGRERARISAMLRENP